MPAPRRASPARRANGPFTVEEERDLLEGVRTHGKGRWASILADPALCFRGGRRSNVDLKDKFTNLQRRSARGSTSAADSMQPPAANGTLIPSNHNPSLAPPLPLARGKRKLPSSFASAENIRLGTLETTCNGYLLYSGRLAHCAPGDEGDVCSLKLDRMAADPWAFRKLRVLSVSGKSLGHIPKDLADALSLLLAEALITLSGRAVAGSVDLRRHTFRLKLELRGKPGSASRVWQALQCQGYVSHAAEVD